MHAWAMPLGERSTQDLAIITFDQHLHSILSDVNFIPDIAQGDASNRWKQKTNKNVFRPPTDQTMAAFNPNLPGGAWSISM